MGDGGAQQVVLNYLRDFRDDPEIDFWLYVYTEPTRSKYDREIAEQEYNVVYLNKFRSRISGVFFSDRFHGRIGQGQFTTLHQTLFMCISLPCLRQQCRESSGKGFPCDLIRCTAVLIATEEWKSAP